jgi:hypothetical protein
VVVMVLTEPLERLVPPVNPACLATTTLDHGTPMESACGAHQDHPDPLAHPAQLVPLDQREALEPLADLAVQDLEAQLDLLALLEIVDAMVAPAQLAVPAMALPVDKRETPDLLAKGENQVQAALLETAVVLETQDHLVHLDNPDHLEALVKQATRDHLAQLVNAEALVQMPTTAHALVAPRLKSLEFKHPNETLPPAKNFKFISVVFALCSVLTVVTVS